MIIIIIIIRQKIHTLSPYDPDPNVIEKQQSKWRSLLQKNISIEEEAPKDCR